MAQRENETSRRDFLKKIAVLSAATSLPLSFFSCSSEEDESDVDYISSMPLPYKIWDEMLMAIKSSPDHLESRMQNLIETKDPEKMFLFVRDEISLIPPISDSFHYLAIMMYHGIPGVLRSGFATPREKAELLNHMYNEAGITSRIVTEVLEVDFTPEEVQAMLLRPIKREFKPVLSKKTINRWHREMELNEKPQENTIIVDKDEKESQALADQLWKQYPDKENAKTKAFLFNWGRHSTPTVQFEQDGETRFAHLFDLKTPFGQLRENNPNNVKSIDSPIYINNQKLQIKVTARTNESLDKPIELISGTWEGRELVGNRLVLSFQSGVSYEKSLFTPIGSLRTFTPAFTFQSFHQDVNYMQERGFIGNPITLDGDVIDVSQEKAVVNGIALLDKPNEDLHKKVANLTVKVEANVFPTAIATVTATDENGNIVEGLQLQDFNLTENGAPVSAMMHNNQRSPKIMFLHDTSMSMPKAYLGEGMTVFRETLRQRILDTYPNAQIDMVSTPSRLFTYLLRGSLSDADLIIYATDGDNEDQFDPTKESLYRNGPPAIILNVRDSNARFHVKTFEKMAEITNGVLLPASDQQATIDTVTRYIEQMDIAPYKFSFYSTHPDTINTLSISIDEERVKASADYQFINTGKSEIFGNKFVGVYLEIKQETNQESIFRTLAGWDPQLSEKPRVEDVDSVRGLFLGGMLFSIEGQGPTLSNMYADILHHRLSSANWGLPYTEGDQQKALEELEKGSQVYNPLLATMMQPLQNPVTKNTMTFASGIRMGAMKTMIALDQKEHITGFDYFQTSQFVTAAADPTVAFKTNLQKTAAMALMEKSMFSQSTSSDLQGKTLIDGETAARENWLSRDHPNFQYWRIRVGKSNRYLLLFDRSASVLSYWRINKYTGELYGILPDGSGGGVERIRQQLLEIQMAMNRAYITLNAVLAVAPSSMAVPLGIVATYGLTLVKLYAIVSEVIVLMDASNLNREVLKALAELACNVYKTIKLSSYGFTGALIAIFDSYLSSTGKSIPIWSCSI